MAQANKDVLTTDQVYARQRQNKWDIEFFKETGWFMAGATPGGNTSTIDKLNFETYINAASPAQTSAAKQFSGAITDSNSYGWLAGGLAPAAISTIDKLNIVAETLAVSPATLSTEVGRIAATSYRASGWFAGGYNATLTPTRVSTIDKLNLIAETIAVSPSSLSNIKQGLTATAGNGSGWFAGGNTPTDVVSTIDKLVFSTETLAASPATLSIARVYPGGMTGNNIGWFNSGQTPTPAIISTIDKLDLSSETRSVSPAVHLTSITTSTAGSGNGWMTINTSSSVSRLDFTTETVTTGSSFLTSDRGGRTAATAS